MRRDGGAAALLLATVAVALVALSLIRGRNDLLPGASPAPATGDVGAPIEGPWEAVAWQVVAAPFPAGDPPATRIDGLVAGNSRALGWGRVGAPGRNDFNDFAGIFVTADGRGWRSVALDGGVAPPDTSEVYRVAAGPAGWLAFGSVCCTAEEGPAIWTSADGLDWTRRPIEGDIDATATLGDAVGTAEGWLIVGGSGGEAAIWSSDDGQTWEAVDLEAAGLGPGGLWDVAVANGQLLAVGTVDDAAGTHDGAIFASDDGLAWRRVAADDPTLTGPDEEELVRVATFDGGVFVVGNHGTHEERVQCEQLLGAVAGLDGAPAPDRSALSCGWGREHHWLSADGESWRRLAPLDPLPGEPIDRRVRPLEFRLLASGGPGLVNLAEDRRAPEGDSGLWTSVDGRAWEPVDTFGPVRPNAGTSGFAILGAGVIAIGDVGEAGGWKPAIWTGQIGVP